MCSCDTGSGSDSDSSSSDDLLSGLLDEVEDLLESLLGSNGTVTQLLSNVTNTTVPDLTSTITGLLNNLTSTTGGTPDLTGLVPQVLALLLG